MLTRKTPPKSAVEAGTIQRRGNFGIRAPRRHLVNPGNHLELTRAEIFQDVDLALAVYNSPHLEEVEYPKCLCFPAWQSP